MYMFFCSQDLGSQKQGSFRRIYGCLFRNVSVELFSIKMQGSHLISPCVWQSDVNRTLCCSENDQIGYKPSEYYQHLKFLKSATAIQAVWGSKCSIAVRPSKIYLGYMKIPRNWKWKCRRCAWWVAELIINHQCRNLSNNFYYIARPLELP